MIPLLFCLSFNIRTNLIKTITGHASPGRTSKVLWCPPPEAYYEVVPGRATASNFKNSVVDTVKQVGPNKEGLDKTIVVSIKLIRVISSSW